MTPDLSVNSKHSVGKRIAANTGLMIGSKLASAILGLGSIFIASKTLEQYELGIILFLHAYMLFFSEVTAFQSWQSIIRFGTEDLTKNDSKGLAWLLKFGVKVDALSALFGFLLSAMCFSVILWGMQFFNMSPSELNEISLSQLQKLALLYCLLILFRQRGVGIGVFRLFDKFHILAFHGIVMPVTRFLGVVIAAWSGAGFTGFLIAWFCGSLAAYFFLPIVTLLELYRRKMLRLLFESRSSLWRPRKGLWSFMLKSNIDSTLSAMTQHLPAMLVMAVFGSAWVAIYKIAEETSKLLSAGFRLLDQVIYPELAKMVAIGEASKIWRLVTRLAFMLLTFGLIMAVFVHFFGPEILGRVTTPEYAQAAPLASLLIVAAALLGIAAPLYPVLYAADRPERAIYARGTGVIIYIISFFILSVTIGEMAPGWAAIFGNIAAVSLLVFLAKKTLQTKVEEQIRGSE
jgi:O-antigen/teichoic acid export membrane protein